MQIIGQVASCLAQLHDQGWVHRDLKPGNILFLPRTGSWTLIDFGLAARAGEAARVGFTPAYAAPEVVAANAAGDATVTADAAVDAWALGVIAFELLSRRPAFDPLSGPGEVRSAPTPPPCLANAKTSLITSLITSRTGQESELTLVLFCFTACRNCIDGSQHRQNITAGVQPPLRAHAHRVCRRPPLGPCDGRDWCLLKPQIRQPTLVHCSHADYHCACLQVQKELLEEGPLPWEGDRLTADTKRRLGAIKAPVLRMLCRDPAQRGTCKDLATTLRAVFTRGSTTVEPAA